MQRPTTHPRIPLTPLFKAAIQLAHSVAQAPHIIGLPAPRAYLVGGAVRDILAQKAPHDIDLEVYHISQTHLHALLSGTYESKQVKANFAFGTWSIKTNAEMLNVSLPRIEVHTGPGHTDLSITLDSELSFKKALARRDFTINAILLDPLTGTILDPYHGTRDFKQKMLRVVRASTFTQDSLRAWRAIQIMSRYRLKPDNTLMRLLTHMAKDTRMQALSGERIRAEMDKLFSPGSTPSRGLEVAQGTNLLNARLTPLARVAKLPYEWRNLMRTLDKNAKTASNTISSWHILLKALNTAERSALIQALRLPKKYRLTQ